MIKAHGSRKNVVITSLLTGISALCVQSQANAAEIEEILVTAERRNVDLQDTPIAVSVLTGAQLSAKGVSRLEDLQFATPSLLVTEQGVTQNVNIRGIGLASESPNVTNGVATYQDGVFQPPVMTSSAYYDIASVEVLRGPQGTFVGANSTGGAIIVNSVSPETDRVKGSVNVGAANYGRVTADGALNVPLGDTVAVRVAGRFNDRDSFYDDVGPTNSSAGELNENAGRLGLLWNPGAFSAIAKIEFVDKETGGFAWRPIEGSEYSAGRTDDIRDLSFNTPVRNDEEAALGSLNLNYQLSNGISLRYISGFSDRKLDNIFDSDATSIASEALSQAVREKQWSQEINVLSPDDARWRWIVGGYFQRNEIEVDIAANSNGLPLSITPDTKKTTTGFFVHNSFDVTSELEVEFGLRYSEFESDGVGGIFFGGGIAGFPAGGIQVADLSGSHTDNEVTGKLGLNWHPNEDNMIYAFVAKGYKPGGFNSTVSEFDQETVVDYELGWKSTFLGGQVKTQLGLFYNDYNDFQFMQVDASTGQEGVANVSGATIQGVEGQIQASLGEWLLDAGMGYVDSELDVISMVNTRLYSPFPGGNGPQCPVGTPSSPPICFDYGPFITAAGGGDNLYSPEWSYNIGIQYDFSLPGALTLTPRLNYSYIDSSYTSLFYADRDELESRYLLSAMLRLSGKSWMAELYGTNLTDEEYVSGQASDNEFYGAPREYGVRLSHFF